jgi:hypothetical protein
MAIYSRQRVEYIISTGLNGSENYHSFIKYQMQ